MKFLPLLLLLLMGCGSEPETSTATVPDAPTAAPAATAENNDPWRGYTVCELVPERFFATLTPGCANRIAPVGETNKYEGNCLSGCQGENNPVRVLIKPVRNMERIVASEREQAEQSDARQLVEVPGADIAVFYPSDRQTTFYAENFRITVVAPMTELDDAAVRAACGDLVANIRSKVQ